MDEPLVHEVAGPAFTPVQAAATIGVGVVSLLISNLLAVMLGALAEEHRITTAQIGVTAMLEALSTGVFTALAGAFLKARRLRAIGVVCALLLAALDLLTTWVSGGVLMGVRTLAGAPEGLMLWITVGMIARTTTPERWAAVLMTSVAAAQVVLATAFAVVVLPQWHADGAYGVTAAVSLLAIPLALLSPDRYGELTGDDAKGFGFPVRGWLGLASALLIIAALSAVGVYLVPLATQAGLTAHVAQVATAVSIGLSVPGGLFATGLAGRVHYLIVFVVATAVFLIGWVVYGLHAPGWLFITVSGAAGLLSVMIAPFLVPMLIEADPTRRTALQSGGAQLLGGALGPLLAAMVVGERDVHGVLWLGGALLLLALLIILGLKATQQRLALA